MFGGMGHDHDHDHAVAFDGMTDDYRRRLIAVIVINAAMFVVEMAAGALSGSQALKADALDFFADSVTYAASFAVLGMALRTRSLVALGKGASLFLMALWVLGSTIYRVFVLGTPSAEVMGVIGFLALAANVASVVILMAYKDGDANVRSVWLCSRNDAIGNVAVMIAALGVWGTMTAWPDLIVAAILGGLFFNSSIKILRHAWAEYRHGATDHHHHDHAPAHIHEHAH
jgi:Co/Zn/Cd efflux system component